jgi:NADPH-dependent 2,4-dienoyl-CoA reductase/sulfur reductase-like enzyme
MSRPRIVIVGASLAGATAAATLRDDGFDGEIRLIDAEAQLPYNRPPLSKGYLRQEERFEYLKNGIVRAAVGLNRGRSGGPQSRW